MIYEELDEQVLQRLRQLAEKYAQTGQDLASNLEGLLYTDYLKYWDYIALDTLLSLQRPRTALPDEMIFVIYHQITELFFKLILWEIDQLLQGEVPPLSLHVEKMQRINRYVDILAESYSIMIEGMDREQFRRFRMALLPASGFQSVQFREIELKSTPIHNLLDTHARQHTQQAHCIEQLYAAVYWKRGAIEMHSQKKTITLEHFEQKYDTHLLRMAIEHEQCNLYSLWQQQLSMYDTPMLENLKLLYRHYDYAFNIKWRLAHLRSAAHFLKENRGEAIPATGGTNWTRYLPPRFQKIMFFPTLWTEDEKNNWGTTLLTNQAKH